jgi:hypothetical protein
MGERDRMRSPGRKRASGVAAVVALAALAGCDAVDDLNDRFKTCQDTVITLTNGPQAIENVNIIGPGETFTGENYLASGESRQLSMCIEKGDRKRFRVAQNGVEIAAVNCVASLSDYQAHYPKVEWTPEGIRCLGW